MASPARRLSYGPWPVGLVLKDTDAERDPAANSQSLQECLNFDITNEGYLRARPGVQRVGVKNTHYTDSPRVCKILGNIFENGSLMAVLGIQTGGNTKIYLTPDGYTMYSYGTVTGLISAVKQYNNVIYLIRSDDDSGYSIANDFFTWPAGTPNSTTTITTMPRGTKAFVFKDRLFIINKSTSTIYFSAPAAFDDYTVDSGGGFFIVEPSNDVGASIMDVVVTNEVFYIFKRTSTYLFSYDSNPNDDGVLRLINSALGAFSATPWENDIYIVNTQGVYRIVNGTFVRVDEALDLRNTIDLSDIINPEALNRPLFIHAFANRLLIGQFGNSIASKYGFNYVCMNLTNGAWTSYRYMADGTGPGAQGVLAQKDNTWGEEIFSSMNGDYFVRVPITPAGPVDYTFDGQASDTTEKRYIPKTAVTFYPYNAGYASIWKKIHRFFIRAILRYPGTSPLIGSPTIEVRADKAATAAGSMTWVQDQPPASVALQSEYKLPIKQHRGRNFTIRVQSAGELVTGRTFSTPPSEGDTQYEMLISEFNFDVSFPRGMSSL